MDKQQVSNLLHIQQACKNNRLVVFVGAGVSKNSGIPTWNELIERMKSELPEKLRYENDALKIAQLYKDSRGHKEYMDKVKEVLLYNKTVPNQLHTSILSLNPCHIITTNYDDLIEQELLNRFVQYDIVREDKNIPQIKYPNVLVKMHGDYLTDNIVLTETDYYNYYQNFPLTRAFVQSIFASKLVLFVGFSFSDLNLKMILNELKNILSENMQRAYLLSCEEPDYSIKQYFEKKGINILYFSEKDIDNINGTEYKKTTETLGDIGLHTDKILFAIKNYSIIPKQDLASYLYNRVTSFSDELRSFGDGLRYFFPQYKDMLWHPHSSGLQTNLSYFNDLAKQLNTNEGKRKFLNTHPLIDLRTLLRIACYNYLYEIDRIKIIDDKFIANVGHYIPNTTMNLLHYFNYIEVCNRLKRLYKRDILYTIDDLELPFTLYLLGDYWEAYRIYTKLLPLYWNRQKYILYFICRYNIWSIRKGVRYQKFSDKSLDIEKELELAKESDLDDILRKLPLDVEIKKIFQDLISYRSIGSSNVKTETLRDAIYQQRKSAEKGGCSINSNIQVLLSIYHRERIFCSFNYIICDNNTYYRSVCYNTALGILNSYATPSSKMFEGIFHSTKIISLNDFMIEILIFDIEHKQLKNIIDYYEISSLQFEESGVKYINLCLGGLVNEGQFLFKDESLFYNPFLNLLLLISKSLNCVIKIELLYKIIIKFWKYERFIEEETIIQLLKNYPTYSEVIKELLDLILYKSFDIHKYEECIVALVKTLEITNTEKYDVHIDEILANKNGILILSLVYPVVEEKLKKKIKDICLDEIDSLYYYISFIYNNRIRVDSNKRFLELLKKDQSKINEYYCHILSNIRKNSVFCGMHSIIDELSKKNECLQFFISPMSYHSPENVEIDWILLLEEKDRMYFFQNDIYRNKLKVYITKSNLDEETRNSLIDLL